MGSATQARRTPGLWIAAGLLVIVTGVLFFYNPQPPAVPASERASELDALIGKATTYYEFGHFDRAVESYRDAIELGMVSGAGWYEYAHAHELAGELDLEAYATAYGLLLEQSPDHELTVRARETLAERATVFDYDAAATGEISAGTLVTLTGTVSRIRWGRVESHRDTLIVATRPDEWLGHVGNEVVVDAPRHRRYQTGETMRIIGWLEGWQAPDESGGMPDRHLLVRATGIEPAKQ